jgi:hypothetical protein
MIKEHYKISSNRLVFLTILKLICKIILLERFRILLKKPKPIHISSYPLKLTHNINLKIKINKYPNYLKRFNNLKQILPKINNLIFYNV